MSSLTDAILGDGNMFSGTIPTHVGDCLAIKRMCASRRAQQQGAIQQTPLRVWMRVHNLRLLVPVRHVRPLLRSYLDGSRLTGPIPTELGRLSSMTVLWLHANMLTGTLPASLGMPLMRSLSLHTNQLTGFIPSAYALATALTSL